MKAGRLRPKRGSAMVEMAVALPVFLLLVFGVFTIGTVYNHQMTINTAARTGARLYAVGHEEATCMSEVQRLCPNLSQKPDRFAVFFARDSQKAECTIVYKEKIGMPVLSLLFNNKELKAYAEHFFETDYIAR